MKLLLAVVLTLLLILLPGCRSYVDLDELLYVTSLLVDISDSGTPVLYAETFRPVRSGNGQSGEEVRTVYRVEDRTVSLALSKLSTMTSATVSFSHCKVMLLSQRLVESGRDLYDMFDRRQDFIARTYLCVFVGDPKLFVDTQPKAEKLTGLYLFNLVGNTNAITVNSAPLDFNEFLIQYAIGDEVASLPIVSPIGEADGGDGYLVRGLALMRGCKLVGTLEGDGPKYYNMMLGHTVSGLLAVPNPDQPQELLTVEITNCRRDMDLDYDGKTLKCTQEIDVKATLSEVQGVLVVDGQSMGRVSQAVQALIAENCKQLFDQYKQQGTDVFGLQEAFARRYPQLKGRNIISDTEFSVDVTVDIQETTTEWSSSGR